MKTSIERHETELIPALIQQPLQQVFDRPAVFRQIPETEDVLLHGQLVRVT